MIVASHPLLNIILGNEICRNCLSRSYVVGIQLLEAPLWNEKKGRKYKQNNRYNMLHAQYVCDVFSGQKCE